VGMLVLRFPAVVSLEEGLRAVSSLPALSFLILRYCVNVTAAGVQALRNTTAAPNLHIESSV
jgi:hypothetical protein